MSESSEMMCAELADVAAELALGVLTGRERAMAVEHLDTCDACREDVRQLMATGEQLLEMLPPAEPPAGFEIRVLARLGLPVPPQEPTQPNETVPLQGSARRRQITRHDNGPRHRLPVQGGARPRGGEPGGRPGDAAPRADRPGGTRRPGRTRRALAAASVGLAVAIAAGLGGWRIGAATSPAAVSSAGGLTSASLLSATHQSVGNVFLYSGNPRWLYMAIDMEDMKSGNGPVTCQLVTSNGRVTTLGTFRLADGYGEWGSPDPGDVKDVTQARLVSAAGTVLATASFPSW